MACPVGSPICFYRTATFKQILTVIKNGAPVDITNWTITFKMDDSTSFEKEAAITDGPGGIATLDITNINTGGISAGHYKCSYTFDDPDESTTDIYTANVQVKAVI